MIMKNNKKKNKKYSLAEKEKLAKLYTKYKEEYENQEKVEKYSGKKKESLLIRELIQRVSFQRL